jgi:NAD(P)-dependent dehydrogenase (short-subunit alcohol dehydrogenase family)
MSGKVALVTGASRGIGRQLCQDLAGAGYDIVCVARSSAERPGRLPGTIEETAARVRARGGRVMAVALDVRDEAGIAALAARVFGEWGRCDLLVNNAAIAPPGSLADMTLKHWQLAFDVNVHGPMYFIRHFGPRMRAAAEGRIVNVSSSASVEPGYSSASYMVTKGALETLTLCAAHELAPNVAVNAIRLELDVYSEGYAATLEGQSELPEFEDPVIMSDAVLWLAARPTSMTGRIMTITELREVGAVRPPTRFRPPHGR